MPELVGRRRQVGHDLLRLGGWPRSLRCAGRSLRSKVKQSSSERGSVAGHTACHLRSRAYFVLATGLTAMAPTCLQASAFGTMEAHSGLTEWSRQRNHRPRAARGAVRKPSVEVSTMIRLYLRRCSRAKGSPLFICTVGIREACRERVWTKDCSNPLATAAVPMIAHSVRTNPQDAAPRERGDMISS
ncbi:hypothetical protein EJ03DRAFT_197749 [Teratosphaeria nubilosa]|uniref:Uncharacterized protein n=1 Tax=Teratosphaeria nubilosa TaxID=161662 RepID=A0A6G1KZQ6_9PEZI|nr:hypothetical protein EJ03DRAFT_197749 [Teratosphaeria nubilosa]